MSLDFSIEVVQPTDVYWRNITHNVSPMWKKAGVYETLYETEGRTAGDLLPQLRKGLAKMRRTPAAYRKLNAPNGWGTYEHALEFLEDVIRGCAENPNGRVRISA